MYLQTLTRMIKNFILFFISVTCRFQFNHIVEESRFAGRWQNSNERMSPVIFHVDMKNLSSNLVGQTD